jgi:hypothetical protein
MAKHKLVINKDDIEKALIAWAEDANAEEKLPSQALIDEVHKRLDNFSYLSPGELEQQEHDYERAYLGEQTKVGDLVWYDGECLCGAECLDGWTNETINKNKHYSIQEIADDFVIYHMALAEFKLHGANI